jgi:DNA-binding PadR family transcriptional regulator
MSFLQPCLLFILSRGDAHGYSLHDGLDEFGFDRYQLDPSLVYRALRNMEEAGWVSSRWDEDSQGPRRRVYQLLPEGKTHLAVWIEDLRRTRAEIDRLLQTYDAENQ